MSNLHLHIAHDRRLALAILLVSAAIGLGFLITKGAPFLATNHAAGAAYGPASPPGQVCDNASALAGPSTAPAGAVTVPSGDNSNLTLSTPDTTYWFAPGTHTLGTSEFSQIHPGPNDTYIGAPGAVIDGQNKNHYAFVSNRGSPFDTGVTIEYLTIQHFNPPAGGGAVNENAGPGWTIKHDVIRNNVPGAAIMLGTNSVVEDSCITENGQYAFNGFTTSDTNATTGGPSNITVSGNEISKNDTCNWEAVTNFPMTPPAGCRGAGEFRGCDCSGGGRFREVRDAKIADNWVHDNYDVGLWADTNNDGLTFSDNYIANNYSVGLKYEVSYNALIDGNTFAGNGVLQGATDPGLPTGAVYISESGGDSRVANEDGIKTLTISNNTFTDNWDGVVLWENANRFCSNGLPGTQCTLVDPAVASASSCRLALTNSRQNLPSDNPDYFDLCRWKTQNVSVRSN
ncbi:MAG: right-handed parallel beta-helix repeat-containing protein, partial [Mycobacterium sp.]|nr:right-handed parallel beta-helix repeat-containing protein [Mycobacterium sp.]